MKENLKEVDSYSQRNKRVNQILAEIRAEKPVEVVIWYSVADRSCGVRSSPVMDRTKVVGALTASAIDVWNA